MNAKKQKLEEAKVSATTTDEEPYVPTYIHKNVGYSSFGTATDRLTDGQKLAFNFVVEQYHIPSDFETNLFVIKESNDFGWAWQSDL